MTGAVDVGTVLLSAGATAVDEMELVVDAICGRATTRVVVRAAAGRADLRIIRKPAMTAITTAAAMAIGTTGVFLAGAAVVAGTSTGADDGRDGAMNGGITTAGLIGFSSFAAGTGSAIGSMECDCTTGLVASRCM